MVVAKPTKKGTTVTTDKQTSNKSTSSTAATKSTSSTATTKKSTSKPVVNNSNKQNETKKVVEQKSSSKPVTQVEEEYSRPISGSKSLEKINENEWFNMNLKSGGSFINIPPILIDQSNLLLSNNNTIKIYNPTSGQLKSQVSLESNNEMITYIASTGGLNSTMTIYLSSSLGKFYQYDINKKSIDSFNQDGNNSSKIGKINKFIICPINQNIIYFITEEGALFKYNRSTSEGAKPLFNNTIKEVQFISISRDGNILVVANKSLIQVLNLEQSTIVSSKNYKSEYNITSLSVVPVFNYGSSSSSALSISFGTSLGRLNFISYNKESNQITFSSYNHWHSTPLISSYFNYDGTLLFTGAYENTLAIWTVSTMRRKVLPRLGGAIVHINCDPLSQLLAVTLSNNKVQVINVSDFKSCSIITGLQGQPSSNKQLVNSSASKVTSFIEPITNNLIFSGQKNGIVQFYNIKKDRVEKEIIVSPPRNTDISTKKSKGSNLSNKFSASKLSLDQSKVEPLAFHSSKPLFASFESFSQKTTDKLESKVVLKDQILKFWESFDNGVVCKNTFSIISPHQTNILSMSFHPSKNILLTGSEKDFKLWRKQSMEAIDGETKVEKSYWTCYFESNYRSLACKSTAFSQDGLVYAIACDHLVTLWETETNAPIDVLSFSSRHMVSELAFLDNNQLLVSYKENGAAVWDLSTKKPTRVYNFAIKPFTVCQDYYALSPESSRNRIMIFSNKTHQLLFNTLVSVPKSQVVDQILFSKDDQYDCILCITNENLIYGFTTLPNAAASTSATIDVGIIPSGSGVINQYVQTQNYIKGIKENKRQKVLSSTTKEQEDKEKEKEESIFIGKEIFTKLPSTQEMFGAASHIMPGVQNIYQQYMDSILVNNSNLVKNQQQSQQLDNNNNINNNINNINNNINNIDNSNSNNNNNNNINVKTTTTTTTTTNNNSNKFSSMKNFFDNLDEERSDESQQMETSSNDTASASMSTSTKNNKPKSSSASKKRKEIA